MICSIDSILDNVPEISGWKGVLAFVILFVVVAAVCFGVKAIMAKKKNEAEGAEESDGDECGADAEKLKEPAPGRSGELTLYNVSEREAVLVMAITAEKIGKPLNTLQFVSIKKVEDKRK